jgi:hypothetical protein
MQLKHWNVEDKTPVDFVLVDHSTVLASQHCCVTSAEMRAADQTGA